MELSSTATFTRQSNRLISPCLNALNDDLLVSAARAGDKSAFVELYERHSRRVLPRLYRITKNHEDAEDAFQDAVLRAFLHVKSFEGRSNFTSWLTRIAINSALMVLRKRRGGTEISIEQMCDDAESSRAWEPRDQSETPEAHYAGRESKELLRNAVERLPFTFREALELQHALEYSTSQVAEELGISLSAAKSRLMRARRTVRRRLSGVRPRSARKPGSKQWALSASVSSKTSNVSINAV